MSLILLVSTAPVVVLGKLAACLRHKGMGCSLHLLLAAMQRRMPLFLSALLTRQNKAHMKAAMQLA